MTNHLMSRFLLFLALALSMLAAEPRPNVLFVIVDDLTTTLSCYGDKRAKTPCMDALAARGVRFDRAYCQFALCNPTRASFLTGCYPEKTGVTNLTQNFRQSLPDVVTLPQWFKNHGYAAGRVGKVFHVADPKTKLDVEIGAPLANDQRILDEAKTAAKDPNDPPHGGAKGKMYNREFAPSPHPDKDFTDYEIADRGIESMDTLVKSGAPFFLAVGFIRPHTPYVAPKAYFDAIDRAHLPLPPFYSEAGESMKLVPNHALRPNNNVFRFHAPSHDDALDGLQAYLASTSFVDAQVGRLLAHLDQLKLTENTIVVLTGDHGYQLGEHGLWAKQTLFEGATHVPLIVAAPGVKPGASKGLCEQVDIYPTLTALAGLPKPPHVQGRSLQPQLVDPATKGKQAVFGAMQASHTHVFGQYVRTDSHRYIVWDEGRGGEQLYDLVNDPDELHNLASNANQAERLTRMRTRLVAHLKSTGGNPMHADPKDKASLEEK